MTLQNGNIKDSERQHFNKLAADWWAPDGPLKTLHRINPARSRYINTQTSIANKRLLDIGCGGGLLTESLASKGALVTGIDISEDVIEVARIHALEHGLSIDYQVCSAEELASSHTGHFDVITCMEMLEHVPDPRSIIQSAAALLKPGGHLFLSTINRSLKTYINVIIGAEYVFRIIPEKTHQYSQFIRPSELTAWLRQYDFHVNDLAGINYIPWLDYVAISNDISVNYMLHAVREE